MVGISTNKNEFDEDVAMMLKLGMTKIISPSVSKYVNICQPMRLEMNQMYQETKIYNTWRVDNQPTAAAGIQLPAGAGA